MEAGAALLAGGARVAGAAAAQPARPAELVQGTVGVTVAGCNRARFRPWAPVGGPPAPPGPLLTAAVRVAMMARAAAVTMRAIKLGPARAAASLVAALGQRPCRAAATHYGVERHTAALSRAGQAPGPTPTQAHWGGPAHAGRAGSGSSQEHSGHTRPPQSLLGRCTGLSHDHSQRPALQGWNTGRLQRRTPTPVRRGPAPSGHRETG